jgi:hypothetical protein
MCLACPDDQRSRRSLTAAAPHVLQARSWRALSAGVKAAAAEREAEEQRKLTWAKVRGWLAAKH